ncbi:unnamed protein product [Penicillium salamii]|nr:unnamed protein product [Penicillium salamii]
MSGTRSANYKRAIAHSMAFSSSSSSARSSIMSSSSTVDSDGFFESAGRAGGPQLCSLPGHNEYISRQFRQENNIDPETPYLLEVWSVTRENLRECGVTEDPLEILISGRRSSVHPEPTTIPTILVAFRHRVRSLPSNWRTAAKQIYTVFRLRFRRISVELVDEGLLRVATCYPIPRSHPIVPKWKTICERILSRSDIRPWSSIGCWKYGTEREQTENPVTLMISLLNSATGSFATAIQCVKEILDSEGINDVDILFMINEGWTRHNGGFYDEFLQKTTCSRYVQPGVSIGIRRSSAGASTLGGLIQIKFPGDDRQHVFGLTCFHDLWPPEQHRAEFSGIQGAAQAFDHWVFHPVPFNDRQAERLLQVDHPSTLDLQNWIAHVQDRLRRRIEELRFSRLQEKKLRQGDWLEPEDATQLQIHEDQIDKTRADLEFFQDFLDGGVKLGHIAAASGYHRQFEFARNQKRMLDWALIQISPQRLRQGEDAGDQNKASFLLLSI